MSRNEIRHRGGVADTQRLNAAYLHVRFEHATLTHRAGAGRMVCGDHDLFQPGIDLGIGFNLRPGTDLLAPERIECFVKGELARALESLAQGRQIVGRREEFVDNPRLLQRIAARQQDFTAAVGMQQRRADAVTVEIRRPYQRKPQTRIARCRGT